MLKGHNVNMKQTVCIVIAPAGCSPAVVAICFPAFWLFACELQLCLVILTLGYIIYIGDSNDIDILNANVTCLFCIYYNVLYKCIHKSMVQALGSIGNFGCK